MFRVKMNGLLLIAVALTLAACGGGGGGSDLPKSTSGRAVDGYLSNASVLCDANGNGLADSGESTVVTDDDGGFVFSPACKSTIVVTAGTNVDTEVPFKGMLKAPSGSTVVTPLTSLIATGMSAEQVNTALGLAAGTDPTRTDPAARNPAGTLVNPVLLQRTLAVQQLMQQTTNVIATLGQDNTSEVGQAIYSEVAKATAQVLGASSQPMLFSSTGTVDMDIVSAIVRRAVSGVASTSNPLLATVGSKLVAYSPESVAELVAGSISAQSEWLAASAYSPDTTRALQTSPTTVNAVAGLAVMLESGNDALIDMHTAGQELKGIVLAQLSGDANAQGEALQRMSQNVDLLATQSGIAVSYNFGMLHNHVDYFSVAGDLINIDGKEYLIHDLLDNQNITRNQVESVQSFSFTLNIAGHPIPKNAHGERTATVSLGVEVIEDKDDGRVFQGILDKVIITLGDPSGIKVTVPEDARFYIYGKTSNGVEVNTTLVNVKPDTFQSSNNKIDIKLGKVFKELESTFKNKVGQDSPLHNLNNASGRFYFRFLLTKIDIRKCDLPTNFAPYLTVKVKHSGQPPVSGFGAEGYVNIVSSNPV